MIEFLKSLDVKSIVFGAAVALPIFMILTALTK